MLTLALGYFSGEIDAAKYANAARWYRHIGSFSAQEQEKWTPTVRDLWKQMNVACGFVTSVNAVGGGFVFVCLFVCCVHQTVDDSHIDIDLQPAQVLSGADDVFTTTLFL